RQQLPLLVGCRNTRESWPEPFGTRTRSAELGRRDAQALAAIGQRDRIVRRRVHAAFETRFSARRMTEDCQSLLASRHTLTCSPRPGSGSRTCSAIVG